MRISVIIPTYNRPHSLCKAVHSVMSQTLLPMEVIVVDDGSNIETREILAGKFPDVRYIYQVNTGVSSARNFGIREARFEWLAFLDDDDIWTRDKLESQAQYLEQNPGYSLIHCDETWVRNGRKINQKKKHLKPGGWIFRDCLPLCAISPSSVVIHTRIFTEVGLFDESLPACEDYDLWLRITSSFPVLYVDKKLVTKYGGHGDQLSRKYWGMDRFRIKAIEKIIRQGNLNSNDMKLAIDMLHKKIQIFQQGALKHGNVSARRQFSHLLEEFPLTATAES